MRIKFLLVISLALASCSRPSEKFYFKKAQKAQNRGEYSKSLEYLKKVMELSSSKESLLKASRAGLRIKEKSKEQELKFLKTIIRNTDSSLERNNAQIQIADIYYESKNYKQAIFEFEKLKIKNLKIPQAYFHLNDLDQALVELKNIKETEENRLDRMLLKARIKSELNQFDEAIFIYKELIGSIKNDRSKEQTLLIELAQNYEEIKEYDKAIELLSTSEDQVIQAKLSRLKTEKNMQPGAKGAKK